MSKSILEAAKVIRSKNSGPFELTLDIIFKDRPTFELFREKKIITAELIARLYKAPVSDILKVIWFEPSHAVKITLRRWIPSGAPGESDIYGAQQHAPLLDITY